MARTLEQQFAHDDNVLTVITVLAEVPIWNQFVPTTFDAKNEKSNHDVRVGYVFGSIFNLSLGALLSYFSSSVKPFVASVFTTGFLIGLTEFHMRSGKGSAVDGAVSKIEVATNSNGQDNIAAGNGIDLQFTGERGEGSGGTLIPFLAIDDPVDTSNTMI